MVCGLGANGASNGGNKTVGGSLTFPLPIALPLAKTGTKLFSEKSVREESVVVVVVVVVDVVKNDVGLGLGGGGDGNGVFVVDDAVGDNRSPKLLTLELATGWFALPGTNALNAG